LQLAVSIKQRKQNLDVTGDPWNGRTLEWSTSSPAPAYNFAITPVVSERDPFWASKQARPVLSKDVEYTDIVMPKNTSISIFIGGFSLLFGFAAVWRIWWLAPVGLLGVIVCIIVRVSDDTTEYTIPAEEVAKIEAEAMRRKRYA